MAAASSSTAVATAAHLSSRANKPISHGGAASFPATRKPSKRLSFTFTRRSPGEVSAAAEGTAGEEPQQQQQQIDQIPPGPPSLISALNVEKALRGIAITDVDHYGMLGLQRGCSYDQVSVAYKNKVTELMNQQLPEEQLQPNLEQLKESYSILSTVEERRLYDWSLARTATPDSYKWPYEADITQTPPDGTPPPQEPEDTEPTRLVGYFILGSVLVSFIFSIVLNQL